MTTIKTRKLHGQPIPGRLFRAMIETMRDDGSVETLGVFFGDTREQVIEAAQVWLSQYSN